ncbi:MAG: tycC1, partial [Gemmatimonadetes bacterium]|nr:tycC1 [Gemmatimonadota bacterium]
MATTMVRPAEPGTHPPYPLSPLQHGMLVQTLRAPGSGVNVEQVVCTLREPVDAERLERAWNLVVQGHEALRTRFRWAGAAEPVQEVVPRVDLRIARFDGAAEGDGAGAAGLERYLEEDRARGFDLADAPAMRLALFRPAAGDEWVLVWSFHHILLDGHSVTRVVREAFAWYDGAADGPEPAFPPAHPFRGHVHWLQGRDPAGDQAYWGALLRGLGDAETLRVGRRSPRDPAAEPPFGERELWLSEQATDALRGFEAREGVWLSTLVAGAWALLLGRCSGRDEAVFGVVRSGRGSEAEGAEGMVGMLINTVPFRVPLPAGMRVIDWLDGLAERADALVPHEHAALPDIARWSGLPAGASLFDTVLDYQPHAFDAPFGALGPAWRGRGFRVLRQPSLPLSVSATGGPRLHLGADYSADRFDAATVDRMLGHLARLLEEIARDPERPLGELSPLGEAERGVVVEAWNRTDSAYPADLCIHELFERQAARTPDAQAVVGEGGSITYRELDGRANRLAHHLRHLGVGPEVRVGICLERGVDLVVALLGVLKAGGAYVPMDPAYPAERLASMLADSAATVLLASDALLASDRLRGAPPASRRVAVVSVDGDRDAIAARSAARPESGAGPGTLAYVIYTSGSTGTPKGVMVEHGSLVNYAVHAARAFALGPADRVLQFASVSFDTAAEEVFATLLSGAALVLRTEAMLATPADFWDACRARAITVLDLPTAFWHQLAADLDASRRPLPEGLRLVVIGGERALADRLRAWRRGAGGVRLLNSYGPSETTVGATLWDATADAAWDGAGGDRVPIGRPVPNTRTYVLDAALRPVPVGVAGELCVGGVQVARGYLDRPAATAERFVPDPHGPAAGARLYRTGDQACWREDGTLEFLGRLDDQVKIRGFRIELGEIDAAVRQHQGVLECAILAREDAPGDPRLVAYVAGTAGGEELRAHLGRRLPAYMVPSVFVPVDALPLTPSGKLDRRALPAPDLSPAADRYEAPRTDVEKALADIWAEVLGVERVGLREGFVELGGHSLLATRVVSRIREALGGAIGVAALFEAPTLADLAARVEAERAAERAPLAGPGRTPAGDAASRRNGRHGSTADRALAWWTERLAGAPALLALPTDRPRAAVRMQGAAREPVELSAGLVAGLRTLAADEGATLSVVLAAALQVLLAKHTGSDDVVIGSPVPRRARGEAEAPVGPRADALPLRTDLSGDPGFREALRRVRETVEDAGDHRDVSFDRLLAELHPERSHSHAPIFQVVLALADGSAETGGLESPDAEATGFGIDAADLDLTLSLAAHADGIRGTLEYSTDLFDRGTILRMLGHLERILSTVSAAPDTRLSRLELAGEAERRQVVDVWSRSGDGIAADEGSVHAAFEAQAACTPNAPALVFRGEAIDYRELNERANRLARHLARLGVGPDARVGVCLERSPELVVALLAVLKAGGAYVPLDPGYPAERLEFMLADAGVGLLVSRTRLLDRLPAGRETVDLDRLSDVLRAEDPSNLAVSVTGENLVYVLYTSGSTGLPKGTEVPHRAIPGFFPAVDPAGPGADTVLLQHSSTSWDALTLELWPALLRGGTCVLFDGPSATPAELGEAVRDHGVNTLWLTAAYFNALVDTAPDALTGVRTAMVGGEAVSAAHVRAAQRRHPTLRIVNGYGPSECTVFCAAHEVGALGDDATTIPIGRPVGDRRVYVLDAGLNPVPVGIPGELYVGGPAVARGYLGRPRLTAERFVPDPFGGGAGARLYRTGDRASWRADGTLEFRGRIDETQVKIRGFRIEPGEVEAALRRAEGVDDCAVVARDDAGGEKRLVAYVVGGAGPDALRAHLRAGLPEYMQPGAIVHLDRLPLTPHGKLDRRALPAPEPAPADEAYAAPRTEVEAALAAIWEEVLRRDRVGVHDDFFALGGHSLMAMRVVSRVGQALGVELPMRALFEHPTVAGLAECVGTPAGGAAPRVARVERGSAVPLSFAQERLWFLDRMEPGNAFYNEPAGLRLSGALDAGALEHALGEVVRRHEALRTTFRETGGVPAQVVAPFAGFPLPAEDLSALPASEREAELWRIAGRVAADAFDLAAGPLVRARLLRLADEEHVLLLCIHHVVVDGWSMGVLFRELSALYGAFRDGYPSPLPELAGRYADYAVWQRAHLAGGVLDRHLAWWRERLAGAPALLELPADHPRPAVQTYRGAREPVALSAELVERLRALGRREGATLYMVLLAAFQVLLAKYGAGEDVVVGSPVAGRTRREVEDLIGLFVNSLALRTDLSGNPGFRSLLRRVRETVLGAYEHQEVPFEKVVAELHPERSLAHAPVFQVMLALDDGQAPFDGIEGIRAEQLAVDSGSVKLDLTLSLFTHADGVRGAMAYASDLFDRATVRRMLGHLERLLERVAETPDARISELELIEEGERRLVVDEWNRTDAPYPSDRCIHQLFEEQAARTPDAVAVVREHDSVSYAELNARANRLAHHLAKLGVGPETRVGICLERGPEMLAVLLAVLKAGGAYVGLDPAYPRERLEFTLDDAGVAVLVTRASLRGLVDERAGTRTVVLDDAGAAIEAEPAENPAPRSGPRNLAYLIYTSGSTGRPKGVAIEHGSTVALLAWAAGAYTAQEMSGVLGSTSICFDLSVYELFLPLSVGGRVILVDNLLAFPASAAADQVRVLNTVPSAAAALLQAGAIPTGVTTANLAGEALPTALADALYARGLERVYELYGPSEDTTYDTCGLRAPGSAPNLGKPFANRRIYVLDGAMRPVPVGVPGEMYMAGRGLARGYLGRAALTADRFVPDPFSAVPGERMYRSGDRGRWLADGTLQSLGRVDQQVKVRGFRVEPGEVEATLRRHPDVTDCAVVALADEAGGNRLAAYTVGGADADALRAYLRGTLPEHMVPSAFVRLDALPLTHNGKLDRRALPAPDPVADDARRVAPRTLVEEVVAGIWGEVLGLERVGVHDRFFDVGGHSLLATRVVSRIRDCFGVELPLRALFEAPTVAELAARVDVARGAHAAVPGGLGRAERTLALPLSFAQERLWFLDRMEPGSAFYNVPAGLRLHGALDAPALERALGEVVHRHEALRTVFREVDGAPVQVIAPFAGFSLPVEDLSALPAVDREAELLRRGGEQASAPFDLAAGPLLRASVLRLADEEHALLLCIHHVVVDGWSLGVLFRELSALYAAFREGQPSPLPELASHYADYAVWQRVHLAGEGLDRHLAWWRGKLDGAPAVLELPTDCPRPAVQTYRGAREPVALSADLVGRLRALGRREGATLYMVVLAAFQVLLAKYAGSEDVVVGSPVAGRTRREVEGLIGFFVNTLALRTDLSGDPPFRDALRRARGVALGAWEHQEVPFERVVAELHPERSLSHAPVFQVMLTLDDGQPPPETLGGLRTEELDLDPGSVKFDLTLSLGTQVDGVRGTMAYATDLFDRATVQRMLGHLARLLEQVAAHPDARLSELALIGEGERRQVVEEWNRTGAPYPSDRCIHPLFEEQAARSPDAVAVVSADRSLSYGELNARANVLAHRLVRLGVGPEVRVGIFLERGLDAVVSMVAVLKAGGAYVPMDPAYPADRLARMAADGGVAVLVTRAGLRGRLPVLPGMKVVKVDEAQGPASSEDERNPDRAVEANGLAYVMFTSGSTGTPKGVGAEHRGVVRLVRGANFAEMGPDEVFLQAAPLSFDASTLEVWGPLLNGGRLVLAPGATPTLEEIGGAIARHGVTTAWLGAGLFHAMVEERLEDLGGLRQLLAGGDVLPAEQVAKVRERFPACRVINGYGPTENTTFTACWTVPEGWSGGPVSIGTPVSNTRVYVLDGAMRPAPVGVPGELYAGGDGLARGYLGRPAATAERFVPDPFAVEPGGRLYRTGDRARRRADATLEFLGRLDEQVKIRGFRVEPGEVEATLRRHPGVADCAVVARPDARGDKRLAAYWAGTADADALRAHLRAALPPHMVPSAFVRMDALPLNANGKLDRRALPAPEAEAPDDEFVAPRTPGEELLAGILAEVLRVGRVGTDDSFFDLGGHSLLAMRVVSRVRQVFGVELPLRALFEAPTVAGLAERLEALRRDEAPQLPPVVPVGRARRLPLSFAQERLWFLDRLQPGGTSYSVPVAFRLAGELHAPALRRALGEVVRRHEVLRTTLREVAGSPAQVVAPFDGFDVPTEDLSALSVEDREAEVRRLMREDAATPFDLSAGPLFRARLARVGDTDHVLLLGMHHVVVDGWSMDVLLREVSALYEAYRQGGESPLPELSVQYADHAVWQRENLGGGSLDGAVSWWRDRLAGAPEVMDLPTDRPRPAVQRYRGAREAIELPRELMERLQAVARAEGATLFMVLLGAFDVLLSRYSGSDDVVVGTTIAGRTRAEVEPLIGLFMNTLVLRTDLSGARDFREVLRRVREVTLGAYEHQEVPFERLVTELRPERSLSHSPLFQILFELHTADGPGLALPGASAQEHDPETGTAKYDLQVALTVTPDGLVGGLRYSTDLFDASTARRLVEHLARVLEQVADDAAIRLSELTLVDDAERAQLVERWNQTTAVYPAESTIHALFEKQASRTPDAVAITFGGESLTYRELDARANQVAHHLQRLGVGPEVRVGICLERSLELLPSILGVMKAGGAYVPVDPAHPAERIGYVLSDSAVPVLLTQSHLAASVPVDASVTVISVDTAWDAISAESANPPASEVTSENLAYVIYTSGSTGRPKGVAMHHRGVANYIHWGVRAYGGNLGNGSPVFSSMAVDLTVTNLLPLFAGRTVHLLPEENAVEALAAALREKPGFGLIKITPVHLSLLTPLLTAEEAWGAAHTLVIGADFLSAEPTVFWQENAPGVRLMNEYGPTETVVGCSAYALPNGVHRHGPVPVGGPIQNLRFYVLDGHGQPVPAGLPGELYIGGAGVARGYLGRPGLTAEKFVPEPFGEPGARMYRTGDRARWQADGELLILGRTDNQVKIRGYRVELGEIEAVLRRHSSVTGCLVVVREDVPGDKRLVAYVAVDGEVDSAEPADSNALREHVRGSLPEYMVPAAFVMMDALPQTATGKIDPRTLPAPEYRAADARYVAPQTPVEETLAAIWEAMLGLDRVGVEEGFFELGGHSLLAMRIVSRVREVLGVELPVRALFEGPTVAQLARRVEELASAALPQLPPVVRVERGGPLPLSFAQERLWFLDRMEPGSSVYNVPIGLRLWGALDVAALEWALGQVVRRHDSLRTTFREVNGAPVQVISPFGGFSVPVEDLSALADAEREAAVARLAQEDAARPFDLAAGPLVRARVLRLASDAHVLLLCLHHVVSDGWSMGVLFRELSALYEAYGSGAASPLAELPVQYADYAVWQRAHLRGEVLDRQVAYWRQRLAGAPALLEPPTDHARPPVQTYRGAGAEVLLSASLLGQLRTLARSEGATLYQVLLGAWQVLLAKYTGSDDVVVGSPIAGRARGEVEGLIGFFVNTLVLRTDLSGDPGFREVLRRVRETTVGAWENQELPFERLVAELQPVRSLSHSPLYQVTFALEDAGGPPVDLPGLRGERMELASGTTKFDLTLDLVAEPDGLRAMMGYCIDLFEHATIERMLGHLERVLEQVTERPERAVSELDLLSGDERRAVLGAWSGAEGTYAPRPIHHLFGEQAARTPDAAALSSGGRTLTYRELDAASNRLAHHLISRGAGPETIVAVVAERTPQTVVAFLAALKAGAAYLPLDPEYPADRLRYMLADSGARLLVSPGALPAALDGEGLPDVVDLRTAADAVAACPDRAPDVRVDTRNLAYVIYTSGSTGRPKGVAVTHHGVPNNALWSRTRAGLRADDRLLAFASFSFDAAVQELFGPLLSGAAVVLADRDALMPGPALRETLLRERVSFVTFPPSVLAVTDPDGLPDLRVVLSAGEALPPDVAARWAGAVELHNAYGPTEVTVCASSGRVLPGGGTPAIGRPLENARAYVLDAGGRPVPAGVPGEL